MTKRQPIRKEDQRRHCHKCELPKVICACAEAETYDRDYPFTTPKAPNHG